MKLEKAIEILKEEDCETIPPGEIAHLDATRLGLEALKRLQKTRNLDDVIDISPLPGETKD